MNVYTCTHVVYVCVTNVHVRGQKLTVVPSVLLSTLFWDEDSHWTWSSSPILLDKLGRRAGTDLALLSRCWEYGWMLPHSASTRVEFKPSVSCSHSSTLLTKPSSQLCSLSPLVLPWAWSCSLHSSSVTLCANCSNSTNHVGSSISVPQQFHFQKVKAHNSKRKNIIQSIFQPIDELAGKTVICSQNFLQGLKLTMFLQNIYV